MPAIPIEKAPAREMSDPPITPELVAKHGLTPDEFAHVREILGREPTYTELGIFSVMWSEHCSYKNTRPLLKTFPTKSPKILVGAGEENAGIIDIGDGLAIAFKIESHNHPSAVEPFQGAATGVGGIIRDIFTMGARPICSVNSLRFGPIAEEKSQISNFKFEIANNRRLFAGVVGGIAHYGNCFGIPTVAGDVYFDKSYEGNPLVNAFCLGVLRHDQIARGAARGVGNPVFYVGPATGRDGLAGAAFASQDLTEESADQQRGAVQVGDPFMEKLVCEACLELLATGAVAGIQDMGAAGLTCSTCETAARADTGIEIELSNVPQRAPNMTPYEIMLSESQERMLIIVTKGREEEVKRIFDKWDLPWAQIGTVTDTGRMVVKNQGRIVADIPAKKIANESPIYYREAREPAYLKAIREFRLDPIPDCQFPPRESGGADLPAGQNAQQRAPTGFRDAMREPVAGNPPSAPFDVGRSTLDVRRSSPDRPAQASNVQIVPGQSPQQTQSNSPLGCLKQLLARPTIASKNWVYRQYDHMVRDGTAVCPGSDAAVLRIKADSIPAAPTDLKSEILNLKFEKHIAISVDCNAAYVYLDPYEGAKTAVAEVARNLACSGAIPLGVTDNLNFGNPHNPELFWQLKESVRGLAEACKTFNAPVTGGNCSLYNQSPAGPIDPTPTVAMVGLIEKPEHIVTQWFKDEGDAILLLGAPVDIEDPLQGLGGSAYLQVVQGQKTGSPPRCNLELEKDLNLALRSLIYSGAVKSAHDCSEGGLAVALAESCISQQIARGTPRLIGADIDLAFVAAPPAVAARKSAAQDETHREAAPPNPGQPQSAEPPPPVRREGAGEKASSPANGTDNLADAGPAASPQAAAPRLDALLFGETQGRIIISVSALNAGKVLAQAKILGIPAARIGTVGGSALQIKTAQGTLSGDLRELHDLWWNAIARAMSR